MSGTDVRQQQWGPQLLQHLQQSKLLSEFVISGTGVACGTTITNPIDVVKTRLQLQPHNISSSGAGHGLLSTGVSVVQQEGLLGLWKGWAPAVVRGMFYGGLRLGLYNPVKQALAAVNSRSGSRSSSSESAITTRTVLSNDSHGIDKNIGNDASSCSGSTTGSCSSSSSSSSSSGKSSTRSSRSGRSSSSSSSDSSRSAAVSLVQGSQGTDSSSSGTSGVPTLGATNPPTTSSSSSEQQVAPAAVGVSSKLLAGVISGATAAALLSPTELVKVRLQAPNAPHNSALAVVSAVVQEGGVRGLWKGATPGVVRAAVLTASQCATYDEVKGRVMAATGWRDTASTHLATAMITGLVSTTATNPVDVVKTFMFVGGKSHSNPIACAAAIYHQYGLGGFWRGWLANYTRLGPQTVVTFLVVEQLRATMGMSALGN